MEGENERRRSTAREHWLGQLTPEQRAALPAKYPCHREHQHEQWCRVPDESRSAVQRSSVRYHREGEDCD